MNKEEVIQKYNLNRIALDNAINIVHQMRQTKKRIKEQGMMMDDCCFVANCERWMKAGKSLDIALEKLKRLENRFMKIPLAERCSASRVIDGEF